MSSGRTQSADGEPGDFPDVPPPSDLGGYKGTIAFSLGELTTTIRHLADGLHQHGKKLDKFSDTTESGLKEQKEALKALQDKILVAETRFSSAFYTSKWFFGIVALIVGWAAGHWNLIMKTTDSLP